MAVPRPRYSLIGFSRPAFTLIELLVVVAIITLLLAILLPSLRAARAQAKRTVCMSNQRSIMHGWELFFQDREIQGRFPKDENLNRTFGGQPGSGAPQYGHTIKRPLNPYLQMAPLTGRFGPPPARARTSDEGPGVFACPSDAGGSEVETTTPYVEHYGTSYQTNVWLVGQDQIDWPNGDPYEQCLDGLNPMLRGMTTAKIDVDATKLVLLGDGGWWMSWNPRVGFNVSRPAEWHDQLGHHNLAFLDGHVEFVRVRKGIAIAEQYNTVPFRKVLECLVDIQQEQPD